MSVLGLEAPKSDPCTRFWNSVSSPSDMGRPTSMMLPRPVTTTVPALRMAEKAWPTCSGRVTPTVTMALSAPCPLVRSLARAAASSMEEAAALAKDLTNGQGADSAIVTVGVTRPEHVGQAFSAIRKAGTVVVTGLGNIMEVGLPISLGELTLFQKRVQGSLFGASNPSTDILKMLRLYTEGRLKLDELVTRTYTLDEVAQGYEDMHAGKNIRGVIVYD